MSARNELILADMIAVRAESAPDFDVVTFDGGGVLKTPPPPPRSWSAGRR